MDGLAARPPHRRWRFADIGFDEASLTLTVAGRHVELERRPLQLLALLLAHAGEVVTKDEILDALWPGREVTEASLTNCMARLRQALGETGHKAIRTVHGYGYRLAVPVSVQTTPSPATTLPQTAALSPGDPVPQRPQWHLTVRLGTGGYGDVWLGEQITSRERRVFKFARDDAGRAALKREVALFRLLREELGPRPDLILIQDWNFDAEPAFIETAWAEQGNLADWAAAAGGAAALPLDLRLSLAAQIAEALAAIHAMSVLHKDLKPANILIRADDTGEPAIVLTDFGSGRALDPSRLDAYGITRPAGDLTAPDSSGTTQLYRAPELADGGAPSVQSDIFALGIMLFQLAAGDLRRTLAPGWEALVPDPLLREDIAAAAAGDPARRLQDASDLAQRLRSLPERRAARAHAEAAAADAARTRRALELARARRVPLLALLAALVFGLATSIALYVRAERARADALAQAERARAVTAFLTDDLFSAANPELGADPNIPIRRILDSATADLDRRFAPQSQDRAAIEAAIGGAYAGLGDAAHALPLLDAALEAARTHLGEADPQTLSVRLALATLAEHRLDLEAMRQQGIAVLAAHPQDPATELAARFAVLISGCGPNGNATACVVQLRPLYAEIRNRLGARDRLTLHVESDLASRLADAQLFAQAIPMARDAVAVTRQVYGPDSLPVQLRRFFLAADLRQAGQFDEAITTLIDVRAHLLAISGGETDTSIRVLNQLGMTYYNAQRYSESLQALQAALDYNLRTRGEMAMLTRGGLANVANTLSHMGRTHEAIAIQQRVLDLEHRATGPDSPESLSMENNLAGDYERDGDLADAERLFRDVVSRAQRVFTHGEYLRGYYEYCLGTLLVKIGQSAEARGLLKDSVAALTQSLGPDAPRTRQARGALAELIKN